MIDGHALRRDTDVVAAIATSGREARVERLRQHFSPREAQLFGIDQAYDAAPSDPLSSPLLRGIGAALASATLFLAVGALAIPAAAFA